MRYVTRNPFARHTIRSERVTAHGATCAWCGSVRHTAADQRLNRRPWLLRFHTDDDQGPRQSGPIANGKLFCSRSCCETYIDQRF